MIRTELDINAEAMYVRIADTWPVRTERIDNGTLVDVDRDGSAVGIEILNPVRPWPVEEILSRFDLAVDDAAILRALSNPGSGGGASVSPTVVPNGT